MLQKKYKVLLLTMGITFATSSSWALSNYTINSSAATEAKVHLSFSEDEGASYGPGDPYGTYFPAFPSMNDNGDVSGHSPFSYTSKTQWEAAVWVNNTIHRFGVLYCSSGDCQSRALKMNNSRTSIVGSSIMLFGAYTPYFERPMKWDVVSGAWTKSAGAGLDINYQGYARDVNDSGNLIGSSIVGIDYIRHAQARIGGVQYTIGSTGVSTYEQSLGTAINSNNYITGSISDSTLGATRAFMWGVGQSTDDPTLLPTLGGATSIGYDINDSLMIVGAANTVTGTAHAFKWQSGSIYDLGTLGGNNSTARSVNNAGVIAGYSEIATGEEHAFVYSAGVMYDLNNYVTLASGWVLVDAYTVNDNDQILVRARKNGSIAAVDNAYWILSPQGYTQPAGPVMVAGNAGCHWGQTGCDVVYPPVPANNTVYEMPDGAIPVFTSAEILPLAASTYVCNANCGNYSAYTPMFSTINAAISSTNAGGNIVIFPGVYNESITLSNKNLIGLSREHTIVDATGVTPTSRVVTLTNFSKIENIAVTGGTDIDGGGVLSMGGVIKNCIIHGNTATQNGGGIYAVKQFSLTLTDSLVTYNVAEANGGGIYTRDYSYATKINNVFSHNSAVTGGGLFLLDYSYGKFQGNVVDSNFASNTGGGVYGGYGAGEVKNSIITNNQSAGTAGIAGSIWTISTVLYNNVSSGTAYAALSSGTPGYNNIVWNNHGPNGTNNSYSLYYSIFDGTPYCGGWSGCPVLVNSDPKFIDAANGNFMLLADSPAIDSDSAKYLPELYPYGTSELDVDFNGDPRGVDGDGQGVSAGMDYDIGAYEFVPSL